jgi:hypothetical protein
LDVARFADIKATRSRGITKKRKIAQADAAHDPAELSPEHRQILTDSHSEAFVDLPAPYDGPDPLQALAILMNLEDSFQRRLTALKEIGHVGSIDLAENDLDRITRITEALDALLSGYTL